MLCLAMKDEMKAREGGRTRLASSSSFSPLFSLSLSHPGPHALKLPGQASLLYSSVQSTLYVLLKVVSYIDTGKEVDFSHLCM